jgi:hypothetical protein
LIIRVTTTKHDDREAHDVHEADNQYDVFAILVVFALIVIACRSPARPVIVLAMPS